MRAADGGPRIGSGSSLYVHRTRKRAVSEPCCTAIAAQQHRLGLRPPRPAGLLIHTSKASETVHIATECPTSMLQCISTAPPCSAEEPESKCNARESKPLSAVSKALGLPLSRGKRGKALGGVCAVFKKVVRHLGTPHRRPARRPASASTTLRKTTSHLPPAAYSLLRN